MPVKLTLEQRVFLFETYVKTESCREVCRRFQDRFPGVTVPCRETVRCLVNKLRTTGSLNNAKTRKRKQKVLTEEKIDDINTSFTRSPNKSVRRVAQQVGISKTSVHRATKILKLKPYRVSIVQQLQPRDDQARINFCNWILQHIVDGIVNPHLLIFSDEAWFHLSGHVSSQNHRYWSTENPRLIHEVPLHDQKIGVWCAVTAERIIGPIFFDDTINSDRYRRNILEPFFQQLTDDELRYAYFQQDSATAHTAHNSLQDIEAVFDDRVISKGLWPPRSPDLTLCDFYLWGTLKNKDYRNNPHTMDELKNNITTEMRNITQQELMRVNDNFIRRCQECLNAEGHHFQHRL